MSVNKVIILGRLGRDPETKETSGGKTVATLSIATDEGKDRTEWHRVVAWEKTAEICAKYLRKGREVYIEGRLQTRSWEKDGETRYSTEIVADRVVFVGGKGDDTASKSKPDEDDVPW